jgi:hypothetical protein
MMKYPALAAVASLLRFLGILIILVGIGVSIWLIKINDLFAERSTILTIIDVVSSLVIGLIVHATGEFYRCIMDIESNARTATP